MNNYLSNVALKQNHNTNSSKPIPTLALYILLFVFLIGFSVSLFILIVVHNAAFFLSLVFLFALVTCFIIWNFINFTRNTTLSYFLCSFPDSDLGLAKEGQLVKITGVASCGNVSLESSYEKVTRCVYTSTVLYERGQFGFTPLNVNKSCFRWRSVHAERYSTDFYITDQKSGSRAIIKAGSNSKIIPLVAETKLITTTEQCRTLSPDLRKWLKERNLPLEARLLRLEEGYIQEGSYISVIGRFRKDSDIIMIGQPIEYVSTGCLWQRFLLSVEFDGLILGVSELVHSPNS